MHKLIIKIVVFLSISAAPIVALKMGSKTIGVNDPANYLDHLTTHADTSLFFIGSSRVQRSIDPQIIKSHYGHFPAFNLGVAGGTFLSNCVMADFIIQQKGYKVLFIELSPLVDELPDYLFGVSSEIGLNPLRSVLALTQSQSFSARSMLILNVINRQLHNSIAVTEEVKKIIGYKMDRESRIGFVASDKNNFQNILCLLTWEEMKNGHSDYSIDLSKYMQMIDYLQNEARNNNAQLVFFLPITYAKQVEKTIVIPLYFALPETMRLEFPDYFFREMNKEEYLKDQLHLNRQGATTYSRLLIPLLDKHFNK